jgi:DNA-binding SARP family transcriptional activator
MGAWYTVDQSDADPNRFAAGLAAALGAPASDLLAAWESRPFTLVVDNAHLLTPPGCGLLDELLAAAPPGAHIFLAGRAPLAIPAFSRLRAAGQAGVLTAADLAFTEAEAALVGARDLYKATVGWPAALLTLAREPEAGQDALREYIESEVMAGLPATAREMAVTLSALPAWTDAACARMTEADLGLLRRADLPLAPQPDGALLPHPLWLKQLQAELRRDPVRYQRSHRQAALFQSEKGNEEEALRHALAAGDAGLAEPLLRTLVSRAIQAGDLKRVQGWLSATPTAMLEAMPDLLLTAGQALTSGGYPHRATTWLQRAIMGYAATGRPGGLVRALSRLATAHAMLGEWADAEAALRQLEADLPDAREAERGEILLTMARADAAAGRSDRAAERFREAFALLNGCGERELAGSALAGLGALALAGAGAFPEALSALREAQRYVSGAAAAEARLAETEALLLLGRHEEAAGVAEAVRPGTAGHRARRHWLQAMLTLAAGDRERAEQHLRLGDQAQAEIDSSPALAASGLLARACLLQAGGDLTAARHGARHAQQLADTAGVPLVAALASQIAEGADPAPAQPVLHAELLGSFRLWCADHEVPPEAWGRARARGLLQYLLLQPGFGAGREAVLEAFWPDEDPAKSRGVLRVTLHQVRKVLQEAGADLEATPDLVRLPLGSVAALDLTRFRDHLAGARKAAGADPALCLEHCRAGRALYRGELLPGADWPWAAEERRRTHRELLELLHLWQEAARQLDRTEEAIAVLEELLTHEPGFEQAERVLIELLARTGRRAVALQRYRHFVRWLRTEMGLDPSPETQALLRKLV